MKTPFSESLPRVASENTFGQPQVFKIKAAIRVPINSELIKKEMGATVVPKPKRNNRKPV